MILYLLWLAALITAVLVELPLLEKVSPTELMMLGFIAPTVISAVVLAVYIPSFNFEPSVLIAFFVIIGQAIAATANGLFLKTDGYNLYRLPFGTADFYLFVILGMGYLGYLKHSEEAKGPQRFRVIFLLPLLLFAPAVLSAVSPDLGLSDSAGLTVIFSFVYSGLSVFLIVAAIDYHLRFPGSGLLSMSIVAIVLCDMLIFVDVFFPGVLPFSSPGYLPAPFALLLFSLAIIRHETGILNTGKKND
jgi:hypothetical protein